MFYDVVSILMTFVQLRWIIQTGLCMFCCSHESSANSSIRSACEEWAKDRRTRRAEGRGTGEGVVWCIWFACVSDAESLQWFHWGPNLQCDHKHTNKSNPTSRSGKGPYIVRANRASLTIVRVLRVQIHTDTYTWTEGCHVRNVKEVQIKVKTTGPYK